MGVDVVGGIFLYQLLGGTSRVRGTYFQGEIDDVG